MATEFVLHDLSGDVLFHTDGADARATVERAAREGVTVRNADLRGLDLDGLVASAADLTGADFSLSTMIGARLDGAKLTGCTFTHADISGASFRDASLINAAFTGTAASHARFDSAYLVGSRFSRCRLVESAFPKAALTGASFSLCDLAGADFTAARLPWDDEEFVAGVLFRAIDREFGVATRRATHRRFADYAAKIGLAALVRDAGFYGWPEVVDPADPVGAWAVAELRRFVVFDDDHPDFLDAEGGTTDA